ncbi:MAG: EFR1 family ferrodoxin [Muribaculaceae bacterium]|nr:EFR1 family ferrodoxin [Muribaculaceae bacterium]
MIIVFSGCGNTAAVARELARHTGDTLLRLTPAMLRADAPAPALAADGRHIVWAFPTYSWGVPPVVRRFIARAEIEGADTLPHAMVTTCGDDTGLCASMWRADLRRRGWAAGRAFSVQMPNTYVTLKGFDVDPPHSAAAKLQAMPARVAEIARGLSQPGPDDTVRGSFAWLKTRVVYPQFVRMGMSPKPFRATEACTGCGRCAARCPMANITMDSGRRPQWGSDCAFCLGCYHACPSHAVAYGGATRRKGRYPGPEALSGV